MLFTFAFVAFVPMSYAMYSSYAVFNAKTSELINKEIGVPSNNLDSLEVSLIKICFAVHNMINCNINLKCTKIGPTHSSILKFICTGN